MAKHNKLLSGRSDRNAESPLKIEPAIIHPLDGRALSQEVDAGEVLNAQPFGPAHVALVALCAAVTLLDGYDTLTITYAAPTIAEQWHMDESLFGPNFAAHGVGDIAGGER
jgi:hypothetical protein